MNLENHIESSYSAEAADFVSTFFHLSGLPNDAADSFFHSSENDYLVYLHDHGIVIRISAFDKSDSIVHPNILQPLGKVEKKGIVSIKIMPGVDCPTSDEDAQNLQDKLSREGLGFWDTHEANCGKLPVPDKEGNDVYVVVDPGAVEDFYDQSMREEFNALRHLPQDSLQARLYGELYDQFGSVWPEDNTNVSRTEMKAFWQRCREMKENGILLSPWLHTSDKHQDYHNIRHPGDDNGDNPSP